MKLAAGALIESDGKFLLCHPTEVYNRVNKWTIPKGEKLPSEDFWETMIRETCEETNFHLYDHSYLRWTVEPSGNFMVGKDKKVFWFHIFDTQNKIQNYKFRCMSNFHPFENRPDYTRPEVDKFGWFTREQARMIVTDSQVHLFL